MEASSRKVVYLARRRPGARRRRAGDPEEARIVELLAERDPTAIGAVAERYGRFISGFLREATADRGDAEDVYQQVLAEIWRRGPEFEPSRASLLTWMMTIARSRAIDEGRRRRPEPVDISAADGALEPSSDEAIEQLLDRWRVAELLSRIPREEATVLRLRFYEGLAQTEIASLIGMRLGTVKTRMVDGLARLRTLIAEEEGEAG